MKKIIMLLSIGFLITCAICVFKYLYKEENIAVKEKVITIKFVAINKEVFLRAKSWGIAGNHEEIALSEKQTVLINKDLDYVFYTSEIYYKIENENKLILYAPENLISKPIKDFVDIVVIIKGLRTADEIRDYSLNYQKYGLIKMSIY